MIVPIICQRGSYFLPFGQRNTGAIAQLGERVLCKHEVVGSIPSGSTIHFVHGVASRHYDLSVLGSDDPAGKTGKAPPLERSHRLRIGFCREARGTSGSEA